eukprot:SAG31_NODE_6321_length_2066_cov_7.228266_2_plen_83_part_00
MDTQVRYSIRIRSIKAIWLSADLPLSSTEADTKFSTGVLRPVNLNSAPELGCPRTATDNLNRTKFSSCELVVVLNLALSCIR